MNPRKFQIEVFHEFPESIKKLIELIVQTAQPEKFILFGSRARGDHRPTSDFDFCIINKSCTDLVWNTLLVQLEEHPLTLYPVDIVEWEKLNQDYQNNIGKEGKLIYG